MVSTNKLAILRTTTYASIFNYHLSFKDLHQYLINSKPVSKSKLKPYFVSRPHPINLFSQLKWPIAHRAAKILSLIPSIRMVAVTGALAMNNCQKDDDIDLMIITVKNRLWLSRLLVSLLLFPWLRCGRKISRRLCLNLWLDESALILNQQNLYTAHELCQAKPIFNRGQTYQRFITANAWYKKFLPNWAPETRTHPDKKFSKDTPLRSEGESLLDKLNHFVFKLQHAYMKPKITREQVSLHFAFFHPRPTGEIVLGKYQQMTRSILVTGCFDVLHIMHHRFLAVAKKLGGILLVGLETDARVRRLKGPGRPINSLKVRLKKLQQLGIADQVFALPEKFNDLNHFTALINQIKPDILAVSASTLHLAVKRRIMKQFNGRLVVVLPHNPKISTTLLTKKLRNSII